MLSEDEKKLLKIFKAEVEKEEVYYFNADAYTQLLYDSHKTALNLIERLLQENEELRKYDYRKIKIDEENKIKSPSFTKEQLDLINLGVALYLNIPKLLEDESEDMDL